MTYAQSLRRFLFISGLACLAFAPVAHYQLAFIIPLFGLLGIVMAAVSLPRERPRQDVDPLMLSEPCEPVAKAPRLDGEASRVLIVGAGAVGQQLAANLEASGRYIVVGFIDENVDDIDPSRWPILGRRNSTVVIINEYSIDEVCLAYAPTWQQELLEQLTIDCPSVAFRVVPTSYEALLRVGRVQSYGDIVLTSLDTCAGRGAVLVKRAFDITVATLVLLLLSPLWLILAILIKLTSDGPVIFAQERVGLHGKIFRVLKFRTMRQDAEATTGPVLSAGKRDERLTSVGRYLRLFRLDEVPQLWNILRGEMSLVGPRPERPIFVAQYSRMVPSYVRRHDVRPGITGLAQVYGGYHTDGRDKLRFDLIYASHQSFWFDLHILLRTILVVVMPDDQH